MSKTTRTRVIGTTRILESLGKGGMAEVFLGEQELLGRQVAVKIMLPEIAGSGDDMHERFLREARSLAGLHHENIVAIHDLVEKNNQVFMVIEYVAGIDAEELLEQVGRLPVDIALLIATGVVRALEHAHFRNVIHRDIKPSNVMLSRRGEVKLTDFGLAKDLEIDGLTRTGMVVGTPSYLAPEILEGRRADQRTDIYTVGILLYQCLTDSKPYRGKTQAELFRNILAGRYRHARRLNPEVPRSIERIIARCLQVSPEKRWRRAADLHRALERELGKVIYGTPSARLVGYLHEHGVVTDDDLSVIDVNDVSLAETDDEHPARRTSPADPTLAAKGDAGETTAAPDRATAASPRSRRGDGPSRGESAGAATESVAPNQPPPRRTGLWVALVLLALVGVGALVLALLAPQTWAQLTDWL